MCVSFSFSFSSDLGLSRGSGWDCARGFSTERPPPLDPLNSRADELKMMSLDDPKLYSAAPPPHPRLY